jgi:hypothetical protein
LLVSTNAPTVRKARAASRGGWGARRTNQTIAAHASSNEPEAREFTASARMSTPTSVSAYHGEPKSIPRSRENV